ncbi:MAG: hypothetical protein IKD17_00180, partial [Alistipes sp.]|nr:hypothetical protein [Alistipes sp.]
VVCSAFRPFASLEIPLPISFIPLDNGVVLSGNPFFCLATKAGQVKITVIRETRAVSYAK